MVFTKSGQTKGRSGIRHLAKFIFINLQVLTQEKVTFAKSRLAPADAFLRRKEIDSGKEGIAIAFNILFLLHPKQRCPGSGRFGCGLGVEQFVRSQMSVRTVALRKDFLCISVEFNRQAWFRSQLLKSGCSGGSGVDLCPGKPKSLNRCSPEVPRTEMVSLLVLVDRNRKYWNPKSSDAYQGRAASKTIEK